MHEWHRDLEAIERIEAARRRAEAAQARARGQALARDTFGAGVWPGAAIADRSWSPTVKDRAKREEYVVIQLRTAADLVAETRAMHHCVASYARSCADGRCSIWAMELVTPMGREKRQTIEVTRDRMIVQCRGKQNRLPSAAELDVVKKWAGLTGLILSPYVRAVG